MSFSLKTTIKSEKCLFHCFQTQRKKDLEKKRVSMKRTTKENIDSGGSEDIEDDSGEDDVTIVEECGVNKGMDGL